MKTIGLIGGMSWESSLEYYRLINEFVKAKLGDPHSCRSIMLSVDFAEIDQLQRAGEWNRLTEIMVDAAAKLQKAGADLILLCTNTMHKIAADVEQCVNIPLLHIADATAEEIRSRHMDLVGLIGTRFTMEQEFYRGRLQEKHGINVLIPNEQDRLFIHDVIFSELVSGILRAQSRDEFLRIIGDLQTRGAQGVILGCTEIPLLVRPEDSAIPVFDTMTLHAKKAVEFAICRSKPAFRA